MLGVIPPTPAIERAIDTTVAALTAAGHTVVEITPPEAADPFTGFNLASQLLNSDGCVTFNSFRYSFEPTDPGAAQLSRIAYLPRALRYVYYLCGKLQLNVRHSAGHGIHGGIPSPSNMTSSSVPQMPLPLFPMVLCTMPYPHADIRSCGTCLITPPVSSLSAMSIRSWMHCHTDRIEGVGSVPCHGSWRVDAL